MARISTYVTDPIVTSNDKWIGTDFSGGVTKNFTPQKLADFFNEAGSIGVANQISFKYYQTFIGDRPEGSLTTLSPDPNFSSLSVVKISEKSSGLKYILDILNTFIQDTIMISNSLNPNIFGMYKLTNIQEDLSNLGFYNLTLEFLEGNGNLEDTNIYIISSIVNSEVVDKTYVHTQNTASNEWIVMHSLNKYPSVSIIDSGNNVVVGDIEYTSLNEITLRFSASFSGKAYFN